MADSRRILAKYLQAAGNKMGRKLSLNGHGICILRSNDLDHECVIELPGNSDVVYFYSPICKVPYECSEEFFEKIMELNLCAIEYNQATFGLDAKTQNVVLSYTRPIGTIDDVSLTNIICNFVRTVDKAKRDLMKIVHALVEEYSVTESDIGAEMSRYGAKIKLDKLRA
jgi:hypothetical protein